MKVNIDLSDVEVLDDSDKTCASCNSLQPCEEFLNTQGDVCDTCAEQAGYVPCVVCGVWKSPSDVTYTDKKYVCLDCITGDHKIN